MKKSITLFIINVLVATALLASEYEANISLYPQGYPIIERKGYTLAYDGRNKILLWTQEHLTRESVSGRTVLRGLPLSNGGGYSTATVFKTLEILSLNFSAKFFKMFLC